MGEQLDDMAASEKNRLSALEHEVLSKYASEIDAALQQTKQDYHGYENELQEVIFRSLDQRYRNAGIMRQLKLALCRWRLDYQRVYHDQYARMAAQAENEQRPSVMSDKYAQERNKARETQSKRVLEKLRRAVLNSWSQGRVPPTEMHKFLGRVIDTVAKEPKEPGHPNLADPILQVYQEEL